MGLSDALRRKNKDALRNILAGVQPNPDCPVWVKCPECKREWNKLEANGKCLTCNESEKWKTGGENA